MSAKVCEQQKCPHGHPPAVLRFFWPGSEDHPQEVCQRCGEWAKKIAETLGFRLRTESIVTGQEGDGGPSRFDLLEVD